MKKYDLIVVGGGFSGVAAAISAARKGLSALIIDKSNCFGGAASNCLVQPFMLFATQINGERYELCRGIFQEIGKKLSEKGKLETCGNDTFFDDEYLKLILNEMITESGAEILFHANLIGVNKKEDRLESVVISTKSGAVTLYADYFIDATGDAVLTYLSGYSCRVGRESDGLCQPMTLCFRLANVDTKSLDRRKINELYKEKKKLGEISNPREDVLIFKTLTDGVLHFNTTRIVKLNPLDIYDITKAEIEARKQVYEIYEFLKENFECFKNSEIISTASEIGVRESRMIDGEYVLTGEDLKNLTIFDDSIAVGNYDLDIHNPEGSGTSHYFFKGGEYYSIPYRSLIPKGARNLLVCGRCISADHEAQAAIRIMPIVCCIGEAAGAAIAQAVGSECNVGEINVKALQEELENSGAIIR